MKCKHTVKHNGILYPAGAEIPETDTPKDNVAADTSGNTPDNPVDEEESAAEQPPKRGRKPKATE